VFELLTLDNLVNNDFHNTYDLFDLFNGLEVKDLDLEVGPDTAETKSQPNGAAPEEVAIKN
jgi:methylenetetrahydrofolate reductase (NADPH)